MKRDYHEKIKKINETNDLCVADCGDAVFGCRIDSICSRGNGTGNGNRGRGGRDGSKIANGRNAAGGNFGGRNSSGGNFRRGDASGKVTGRGNTSRRGSGTGGFIG